METKVVYGSMEDPSRVAASPTAQASVPLAGDKSLSWKAKLHAFLTIRKPKKLKPVHRQTAFFGLMDKDTYDTILAFLSFQIELFRVVMACLFIIFVPQSCDGATCSPTQSLEGLSALGYATAVLNFVTLGGALLHYYVVFKRERLFIEFLDADDDIGEFQLPKILPLYKDIDIDLMKLNSWLLSTSVFSSIFFIVNIIVSGVYIFTERFLSTQTATVWATNFGLITSVLEKTIEHAYIGIKHKLALSCLEFVPVSYNVIDEGYVDPADTSRGGRDELALEDKSKDAKRSDVTLSSI